MIERIILRGSANDDGNDAARIVPAHPAERPLATNAHVDMRRPANDDTEGGYLGGNDNPAYHETFQAALVAYATLKETIAPMDEAQADAVIVGFAERLLQLRMEVPEGSADRERIDSMELGLEELIREEHAKRHVA